MKRLQRLRFSKHIRDLVCETEFTQAQLIQPLFAAEGIKGDEQIEGLRGTLRQTGDSLLKQIEKDLKAGVTHFLLFNVPLSKDLKGFKHTYSAQTISGIKKRFGKDLHLWVDTCLCSLTTHGHCCVFNKSDQQDTPATLHEISQAAYEYAAAGADGISPSDMMDGRVAAIRRRLDEAGLDMTPVMSYSTKFASAFYGPFRNAANSSPQFGDRSQYQIDVRNRSDALASSVRCAEEGADLLMVKPGMTAIDLINPIFKKTGKPVGAYQVSGEYASLVLLDEKGLMQFEKGLLETWHVFKRAGAQYIITYGARLARQLGVK